MYVVCLQTDKSAYLVKSLATTVPCELAVYFRCINYDVISGESQGISRVDVQL